MEYKPVILGSPPLDAAGCLRKGRIRSISGVHVSSRMFWARGANHISEEIFDHK